MSSGSYIMNAGPYVDPKFPPPEESYQPSYMPPNTDYYNAGGHYGHYSLPQSQVMQYTRDSMQYGGHGGYYQQQCIMPQHQSMGAHMSPQIAQCPSPIQQHNVPPRSPVGSPDPNLVNGMLGPHHMEGSPSDENITELDANGQPVIYPWMKKIHIAGVGEL